MDGFFRKEALFIDLFEFFRICETLWFKTKMQARLGYSQPARRAARNLPPIWSPGFRGRRVFFDSGVGPALLEIASSREHGLVQPLVMS